MKQHPLTVVLPLRSAEELYSIANGEGVVALSDVELSAITSSTWFRARSASQRAMLVVSMYEWTDGHSPRSAARLASELIGEVAHA